MKHRGRPPHPDVLTPREWDVLTLVREGLTNPQIAERLDISFDAAKYHVAEILSKLGLETREEAAAWQPEPPQRPVLRPVWARALGPIAGLWRAWPIAARIAGATVVAATVAGLGVLASGVLRSGGDDDNNIAQATMTGSPATTTPTALTVLPAIALPPNLSIIIEVGCCETPYTGLIRANGENSGLASRQVLFSAGSHIFITADGSADARDEYLDAGGDPVPTPKPNAPGKAPAEDRPYVATYGVSSDSQAMVVGLCIRGSCEGVNAAPNDQGITELYRSLHHGDTWSELEQMGPYVRVIGVTAAGRVLVSTGAPDSKAETYSWEPDHESVTPQFRQPISPQFSQMDAWSGRSGATGIYRTDRSWRAACQQRTPSIRSSTWATAGSRSVRKKDSR
jgi:DNA-binding CsgD family transcriptional regulator